jgi:Membrane protein putatively involved in post-translational modification of the autoinducing quorum-sensing peptide
MEQLSKRIAAWIIKNNPESEESYDVFVYTLECLWGLIMANGILLFVCSFFHMGKHAVIWSLFYNALRFYIGGSHAKTFSRCIIWGTLFSVLCVLVVPSMQSFPFLLVIEVLFGVYVTYHIAPVIHANRMVSLEHRRRLHAYGKRVVIVESLLIMGFYIGGKLWVAHSAAMGILMASILCVIGKKIAS